MRHTGRVGTRPGPIPSLLGAVIGVFFLIMILSQSQGMPASFKLLAVVFCIAFIILGIGNAVLPRGIPHEIHDIEIDSTPRRPRPTLTDPPPRTHQPPRSIEERLDELARLHDLGLITQPEFDQKRADILNSL
ncbi:MAG: SHOCT domain-containing protein [Phycisphaerales bacterium]